MKAWRIHEFGIDKLSLDEVPQPEPGPGQVLVAVQAVSLNYRDLSIVRGTYNPKLPVPRIPCSDGAGIVAEVGPGVTSFKKGDRVAAIFMQNWLDGAATAAKQKGALGGDIDGMLAEYVVLPETGLVTIPEHLSISEASTLPCAALTAWNAITAATIKSGDTVLIQGTGGVSIFALQFAKALGARVIGTSSSDEKLERARALGLDAGLNYRTHPAWEKWAYEQTGGLGVDLVVEVGGAGTFGKSLQAVRIGGMVAQIGVLTGIEQSILITPLLHKQIHVQGIYVGSRTHFLQMNRAISATSLKPAIDSVLPLNDARKAFERMDKGQHFSKLVIEI